MNKYIYINLLLLLFVTSEPTFAGNTQTIKICAALLPNDGKEYRLELDAVITKDRNVKGDLSVRKPSQKREEITDEDKKSRELFLKCMATIVK